MATIALTKSQKVTVQKQRILRQLKIDCMDYKIKGVEIANELGVHPSTISRQLRGENKLDFDTYLAVQVLKEEKGGSNNYES